MRRKDREMSRAFALEVTDTCPYGVLSMTDADGAPYCVPLSIAREGEWVYFHAAAEGTKTDILRQNPAVCLCCVGHVKPVPGKFTTEYESAIIRGTAGEVTNEAEKIHALRLICDRYTKENMAQFDQAIARSLKVTAVWKIHIDEITGKSKQPK